MDQQANVCVLDLFEEQAARTPDAVALVDRGKEISYRLLNERANQLARYLKLLGAGQETRIGLYVEPGQELAAGILGVLKASAA